MSDDDPANVVLAISAMRDCKLKYPDKRFFVINTNGKEFVKLEIFPMSDPVTARNHLLGGVPAASTGVNGRNTGIRSAATSVYISNMDRAIKFYSEGLGLTLQSRIGNEWAELVTSSGVVIGLHPAQPPTTVTPGTIGAINLEFQTANDLESAISSLKSQGVPFLTDIQEYPHVRLITCSDPEGNHLFLAQPLP
jgi:predicted enzyme related to lactoylglutathione lyase